MSSTRRAEPLLCDDLGPRTVVADFSGGHLSSNGGALLLRQIDRGLGLSRELAACFTDRRDPDYVEHTVQGLVKHSTEVVIDLAARFAKIL